MKANHATSLKPPSKWFQNGFHRFLEPYLRRHFHAMAVHRDTHLDQQLPAIPSVDLSDAGLPVLVYCNHPSWWDPLLAHLLNRLVFAPRQFYAPIDAEALEKYPVFERLGFFGVQMKSNAGAAAFLKTTSTIFQRDHAALWLTPEGRFCDARDHDAALMPGLAHLCHRLTRGLVVPIAIEYVFWEERLPECLIRFGECVSIEDHSDWGKSHWSDTLSERLRSSQNALAALAIARQAEPFDNLLRGQQGASGLYDFFRRMNAFARGKKFNPAHGQQFQ
ncbi:MAG: lysophospholipid acyltransferase family protein [Planctomycetota bacterium]